MFDPLQDKVSFEQESQILDELDLSVAVCKHNIECWPLFLCLKTLKVYAVLNVWRAVTSWVLQLTLWAPNPTPRIDAQTRPELDKIRN